MIGPVEESYTVYKVREIKFYSESVAKHHLMIEDAKDLLKTLIRDCTCDELTDQYEEKLESSETRSLDGQVVAISRTRSQLHVCKCCSRKVEVAEDGSKLVYLEL